MTNLYNTNCWSRKIIIWSVSDPAKKCYLWFKSSTKVDQVLNHKIKINITKKKLHSTVIKIQILHPVQNIMHLMTFFLFTKGQKKNEKKKKKKKKKKKAHINESNYKKSSDNRNKTKQIVTNEPRNRGPKRNWESNKGQSLFVLPNLPLYFKPSFMHLMIFVFTS